MERKRTGRPWRNRHVEEKAAAEDMSRRKFGAGHHLHGRRDLDAGRRMREERELPAASPTPLGGHRARITAADRKQGGAGPPRAGGCGAGVRKKKGEGISVQEDISTVCARLRMAF
jgi:hypothetical protein